MEMLLVTWFLRCSEAIVGFEPADLSSSNTVSEPISEKLQQLMVRSETADNQVGKILCHFESASNQTSSSGDSVVLPLVVHIQYNFLSYTSTPSAISPAGPGETALRPAQRGERVRRLGDAAAADHLI